jgi:ribosomal protein S11
MELKNLEIELRSEKQAREAAQHQIELAKEEAAARTREARERAEREVKAAQDEAKALRTILEETERDREEARAALQGRAKKTLLVERVTIRPSERKRSRNSRRIQ